MVIRLITCMVYFVIMAYAVITIIWELLWGYLSQSPNFSYGLWVAEFGFPYLCGIVALSCGMAYLWRNVTGRWGDGLQQDRQRKKKGNVNLCGHKWKRILRIVLSLGMVYSLVVVCIHLRDYGIIPLSHTNDMDTIILQNMIPDFICCGAFIFCLILLWQKKSQIV